MTVLARDLSSGDAVFYIGAGFSMVAGMPGWSALLDHLIDMLESGGGKSAPLTPEAARDISSAARQAKAKGNYQYVASILAMHLPDDAIRKHVQTEFSVCPHLSEDKKARIASRLDWLMQAPISGIITTNYDNLIEGHSDFLTRFNVVALNSTNLPSLFRGRDRSGRFFLKIHGDLNGEIVLSSEDYDRVYLSSPKAENFLRSTLMQNPLVFLGCSVEDAILRQRRYLYELYGNGLPPCYQLTSRSVETEVRAEWLQHYAGIQSVFYEASTSDHLEFDSFFEELISQMVFENLKNFGRKPSGIIKAALGGALEISEAGLGKTNFQILKIVEGCENSRCSYLKLLEISLQEFSSVDMETMVYRIAFLVSVGALKEAPGDEIILTI